MAPSSKNKKKKSKSKGGKKNNSNNAVGSVDSIDNSNKNIHNNNNNSNNLLSQAEVFDDAEEYPTSRVIKRAPNGDVIVESLPAQTEHSANIKKADVINENVNMASILDSHWESLSSEEKKNILKIEKEEVFNMIHRYQTDHNCNCSVCGRRHVAMDQEMERIYNMLYEIDKMKQPDINPVKFHLNIIKELQISKNKLNSSDLSPNDSPQMNSDDTPSKLLPSENIDDEYSKYNIEGDVGNIIEENMRKNMQQFIRPDVADKIKKEVLNFKHSKSIKRTENLQNQSEDLDEEEKSTNSPNTEEHDVTAINQQQNTGSQISSGIKKEEIYSNFTKKFISSHPKIAREYVKKMMMYPDMRAITDELMANSGTGFLKAIEDFVIDKTRDEHGKIDERYYQNLGDVKDFTTMLHKGKPLTPQEYADLQHNIAERMTNSYDTKKKEFKEVSPLEKELFARFMFGDERERFGDMVMELFRQKFDHEFGGSSISASLAAAAAAATLTNPLNMNAENIEDDNMKSDEDSDEYASYDYSDYDDDSEFLSEYSDDAEGEISEYEDGTDSEHECIDSIHHHGREKFCEENEHMHTTEQSGYYHDHRSEHMDHDDDGDDYESEIDEAGRLEEGRRLIQISITKLLQGRILESYHEKQADVNRLKLLQELEDEKEKKQAKEKKKQKKKEKEKEKKRLQQQAKEEEKRRKAEEAENLRKQTELREIERREAQRKKVEEAKKKKDEERKRKLEEQRKREEYQEQQRKLKEEQKRKREQEKKQKEEEQKRLKEEKERIQEEKQKNKQAGGKKDISSSKHTNHEEKTSKQLGNDDNSSKSVMTTQQWRVPENPNTNQLVYNTSMVGNVTTNSRPVKQDINSDILEMISAASQSVSPLATYGRSHLETNDNAQVNTLNSISPLMGNNIPSHTNLLHNQIPFNNIMNSNSQPQIIPPSSGNDLLSQPFTNGSPWSNNPSSQSRAPLFMGSEAPQDISLNQSAYPTAQNSMISDVTGQRKSFTDELDTLTNMFNSSNLADASFSSNGNVFSSDSLWNDPRTRVPTVPSHNSSSQLLSNNNIHNVPGSTSMSFVEPVSQRMSIWNDDYIKKAPLTGSQSVDLQPMPTNMNMSVTDNFIPNNNIWTTGTAPPLDMNLIPTKRSGLSASPGLSSNGFHSSNNNNSNSNNNNAAAANDSNAISGSNVANDHRAFELISQSYLSLLALEQSQNSNNNTNFIPIKAIYERYSSQYPNMPMDYHTFVNQILQMQILHGCEVLNSTNGAVTHIRMPPSKNAKSQDSVLGFPFDNIPRHQQEQQHLTSSPPTHMLLNVIGSGSQ